MNILACVPRHMPVRVDSFSIFWTVLGYWLFNLHTKWCGPGDKQAGQASRTSPGSQDTQTSTHSCGHPHPDRRQIKFFQQQEWANCKRKSTQDKV